MRKLFYRAQLIDSDTEEVVAKVDAISSEDLEENLYKLERIQKREEDEG